MSHYHAEEEDLFNRIVIRDKKWVHHFTPQIKSALKQCVAKADDCAVKAKRERSASKIYLTAFWDNQGILLKVCVATMKETYFDTLLHL